MPSSELWKIWNPNQSPKSSAMKKYSRARVSKSKQPIYARKVKCVGIFCKERNDMSIIKSGETCDVSGIYKSHCVHALERSFSKGQKLPRCERCPFDILWVLLIPASRPKTNWYGRSPRPTDLFNLPSARMSADKSLAWTLFFREDLQFIHWKKM